eukprot:TRINITY_DN15850_c0_g1_i1.p1 TRINITY_DN15850_c0_g1~~TRINITY_DN15850_c0_g1_i1.p1  ORF type:complete len:651 (+),score=115.69 TRINITY_DN15850_c0_g1_i1:119-1954(+)
MTGSNTPRSVHFEEDEKTVEHFILDSSGEGGLKSVEDVTEQLSQETPLGQFVAWASTRWQELHEIFFEESCNKRAMGGDTSKVSRSLSRCLLEKDWIALVAKLGFQGDLSTVFQEIMQGGGISEHEKQLELAGVDLSHTLCLSQFRRFEEKILAESTQLNLEDEGSPAFRLANMLKRSRGNLLRAWRKDLDQKGVGTVTFLAFASALRSLGLASQARVIWTSLRPSGDRPLEFAELAPAEAANLENFSDLLWQKVGFDLEEAWKLLDADHKNMLSKDDFVQAVKHLGFQGNAVALFKGLDFEGVGWIWREEFEYLGKVSRLTRQRLKKADGPLASLTRWALRDLGGPEELLAKLGLGGGCKDITVCDLSARLTALGFDGDARAVAVRAARSTGGTHVPAQLLYKLMKGSHEKVSARLIPPPKDPRKSSVDGPKSPRELMMRRASSLGAVNLPSEGRRKSSNASEASVHQPPPWQDVSDLSQHNKKRPSYQRRYFEDTKPLREVQSSLPFNPPSRRPSPASTTREASMPAKPSWNSSFQEEHSKAPPAYRRYFSQVEDKPVRDEVRSSLLVRQRAATEGAIPSGNGEDLTPSQKRRIARKSRTSMRDLMTAE